MDIGFPANVRHITHVTFDRLQGFLGLPIEFELEVPRYVPSASASVFGVSVESMQCSQDACGNNVPLILLLLQEKLYAQGGLKMEGIFRVNPDNFEEEQLREHINKGIIPDNIDPHCLAGLIKAWFRELPKGVLDTLSPEQVMGCHTEEECIALVNALPPTESALFDWAINLMADVVNEEVYNKMNARNVAVVFAPNMTQMLDPLTALKHAVQVMNLLKTLILKTLRDRRTSVIPKNLLGWKQPFEWDKEKQHSNQKRQQAVDTHTSSVGKPIDKSSNGEAFESTEMHCNLIAGGTEPSVIALINTEIVEEIGSANGSHCSYSTASQRGSGDENDSALNYQGRFSDQIMWDSFLEEGRMYDSVGYQCKQSRPLAYWLRKGHLPAIKSYSKDDQVVIDDGPCFDGMAASRNCSSPLQDIQIPNGCANAGKWNIDESVADGLNYESSPNIMFQLLKETKLSDKEKTKIKLPTVVKSAILNCHARVSYPLSRRTHYLKSSGTV